MLGSRWAWQKVGVSAADEGTACAETCDGCRKLAGVAGAEGEGGCRAGSRGHLVWGAGSCRLRIFIIRAMETLDDVRVCD